MPVHSELAPFYKAFHRLLFPDGCVIVDEIKNLRLANEITTVNKAALTGSLFAKCAKDLGGVFPINRERRNARVALPPSG